MFQHVGHIGLILLDVVRKCAFFHEFFVNTGLDVVFNSEGFLHYFGCLLELEVLYYLGVSGHGIVDSQGLCLDSDYFKSGVSHRETKILSRKHL